MTITVRLSEDIETKLRARLAAEELALSDFVRQAIAEKLALEPEAEKPSAYEAGKHLFGKYSSGRSDVSENADRIVAEIIRDKHRR